MVTAAAATKSRKKKNKSRAIVTYFGSHPDSKPREIAEVLNKRGFKVTPQYVSSVLFQHRKRSGGETAPETASAQTAGKARRGRPPKNARRVNSTGTISKQDILLAKELVNKTGSVVAAREALDLYSDLIA